MKPQARLEWIRTWLREHPHEIEISCLHVPFVEAYITQCVISDAIAPSIEATKPTWKPMMWGAHRVPRLSQDLLALAKSGFERKRIGMTGYAGGLGFPKWVWSYPNPWFK